MELALQKIQYHDDQLAFRKFYQLLFSGLYGFAYSYVHSKENAEEVVSDVFLTLGKKRQHLIQLVTH